MTTHNAVIWYLGVRPCIKQSLQLLYQNYNHHHQYPVKVFSLGRQYNSEFQTDVRTNISPDIEFIELSQSQVPSWIDESELFYNRTEIPYVRKFFYSPSRIGYLHALHFLAGGFMKHQALKGFDWSLSLDDDAFIIKPLPADLFSPLEKNRAHLGDMKVQTQNYARVLDCQIGLRELADKFMQAENINRPKWNSVCGYGAFTAFDMKIFRSPLWYRWWKCVNDSGGIYKYRWGDVEIHSLFLHMTYSHPTIYNYNFENEGLIHHGGQGIGYLDKKGHYMAKAPLLGKISHRINMLKRT